MIRLLLYILIYMPTKYYNPEILFDYQLNLHSYLMCINVLNSIQLVEILHLKNFIHSKSNH